MDGLAGQIKDFLNGIVDFVTTVGVPQDIARTVLLLLIGSQFFSISRKFIRRAKAIGLGIAGALILMNYGPFREVINYGIFMVKNIIKAVGVNI